MRRVLHHRPGEATTCEYWVVRVMGGPPEIVRVRPGAPEGVYVDFFNEPPQLMESEYVQKNVQFLGSLALT